MFGTISLNYTPSTEDSRDASLTMRFSSEATISEMLQHFENFLRAMEYPLDRDSSLQVVSSNVTNFSAPGYPTKLPQEVFGGTVSYCGNMSETNFSLKDFALGQ